MRAISPIANYGITLKRPATRRGTDSTGTVVEFSEGELIHAQFHRGGLTDWEQIVALESFDFSGLPEGVNPLTRVSMFDSEAYVEALDVPEKDKAKVQALIDERLTKLQATFPSEFKIVEKPPAPKPWPTYDMTPFEDAIDRDSGEIIIHGIKSMQEMSGISPEVIRLYEVEHENRAEVIAFCEELESQLAANATEGAISVAL
jgi:hypothetical protein